ncbi:MAG: helix-turn-helix transcriptional regulator [Flavobacterium sp.]|nr:helix-turn-helix transcriptional regulator [Flavobacterium sp.]
MEQQKLSEARKAKGLTQKQMALKIAMEQTTYSRKERGKSPISYEEWKRFAKALDVTVEEIREINNSSNAKNENCTFNDSSIGIQIVTMPQNAFEIIVKYNNKLEEENAALKEQLKGK